MNKLLSIAVAVLMSACANSSGVLKMGPDTYMVTTYHSKARGGTGGATQAAFEEANKQCSSMAKEMLVMNTDAVVTDGTAFKLTFQCLDKNDPAMKRRPTYEVVPDAVIKMQ